MGSLFRTMASAVERLLSGILGLLPGPPPAEGPPPDVDGRRQSEADTSQVDVTMQQKNGQGTGR